MTTAQTTGTLPNRTKRIPAPIYAAAGVGDLAYERLRRLPAMVDQLRAKAVTGTAELWEKASTSRHDLRAKARSTTAELREVARRNAAAVRAGAHAAQERALATYAALVARGERVVGAKGVQPADD